MNLEKDTNIAHYKILFRIGKGGMGEVYLAQDTKLDRRVAIKFLSEEFSEDEEKLSRFVQEAKAASALNHPNILTVYEIGEFEGASFIVTEHIEGKTLSSILDRDPPDIHKALDYAIQITSALAAAHDTGIIHRDIKASNVMIRKDGIAKLLDFGLAKLTTQESYEDLDPEAKTLARVVTVPGMLMGTPNYSSPEQARGKEIDARSDIFSFGILFFELLTGKRPFTGESYADIMGAILKDEHPPLGKYLENVSPELNHILNKTLRKDRAKRYQNIKDLVIDLKDFRDELRFEAKLIHSTGSTKAELIHKTSGIHTTEGIKPISTMQITAENAKRRRFSFLHMAGILGVVALATFGIWWMAGGSFGRMEIVNTNSFKRTEIASWNSAPGEIFSDGGFSPDGKMVAFYTAESGSRDIWIKQTSLGETIQATKDSFDNSHPIWSPTGSEIAFFSNRGKQGEEQNSGATGIWRIPALGGTPILVVEADVGTKLRSWSESGKIYYESRGNLFSVYIETGAPKQITSFPSQNKEMEFISISSDEKQIAYGKKGKNWQVFAASLPDGEPRQIAPESSKITAIVWHPDNKRVLYSAKVDRTIQVFSSSVADNKSNQLTFSDVDHHVSGVTKDGTSILFGSAKEESNLWQVNTVTSEESAVASSIDSELWSDVSPDNQKVVFQSIKNLAQGNNLKMGSILVKTIGSDAQPLKIAETGYLPRWSPQGDQLAFMRSEGNKPQIWSAGETGGREKKLTNVEMRDIGYSVSPYNQVEAAYFSWSPDGKSIVYVSKQNGFSNIRLTAAYGSSDIQITDNNDETLLFDCPMWSSDGSSIAYFSRQKKANTEGKLTSGLSIIDIDSKTERRVFETHLWFRLIGWSGSDQGLIIASPTKKYTVLPREIFLSEVNIETGKPTPIATLKNTYYYNIQISPKRSEIAYVSHEDDKDNILLISIKGDRVRKLTSNSDRNQYFSSLSWSPDGRTIFFGKQTRFSLLSMLSNFK